jgi:hypothetical protein
LSQLACAHTHETLLWATKGKGYTFNYDLINSPDPTAQMSSVWRIPAVPKREKLYGYHPTQKPLRLVRRALHLWLRPNKEISSSTRSAARGLRGSPPKSLTASSWGRSWRRSSPSSRLDGSRPPDGEVFCVRSPAFTQKVVDPDQGTGGKSH